MADVLTVGDIARRTGKSQWRIRRLIDRMGIGSRLGVYRVIRRDDLHLVEDQLSRGAP